MPAEEFVEKRTPMGWRRVSLPDASIDSRYCQAETPGSTSIFASVAGYCDFFNKTRTRESTANNGMNRVRDY